MYDTMGKTEWIEVASLEEYNISNITRLAVSTESTRLALVGEPINK